MIKVGIVGGTGYTGVELLRLLAQHPDVQMFVDVMPPGLPESAGLTPVPVLP